MLRHHGTELIAQSLNLRSAQSRLFGLLQRYVFRCMVGVFSVHFPGALGIAGSSYAQEHQNHHKNVVSHPC